MAQTREPPPKFDRPPSKPIPVAPGGTPNTLVLSGIGLSTLCGKPGKWSMQGISGAYVMCRQETHLGGLISGLRWVRYGRTNASGCVVEVEEDELDQPVPVTPKSDLQALRRALMLLLPDERYTLFYSCDREHFMDVKARVAAAELRLEQAPGAIVFEFTRLRPRSLEDLDLIPWLRESELLDEQGRDMLATHLLNPERGFVKREPSSPPVASLDATPEPLKVLFRAEFLQWYALMAAKRSGEHLAALQRACSLIAASDSGARDALMEERVAQKYAKRGTPEHWVFDRYRDYAWKCAAAGQHRDEFLATLPTRLDQVRAKHRSELDLRWEALAEAMRANTAQSPAGPAEHPGLDPSIREAAEPARGNRRSKLLLGDVGLHLVCGYFDLYTLGARLKGQPLAGRGALLAPLVEEFEAEWEQARNRRLPASCRALLARARYPELTRALRQHTGSAAQRLELQERYFDACAWAEHPWWSDLTASDPDAETSLWKHLAPNVKWLSEALKGAGKTLSGLVETRLNAYALGFTEAHELLQALFRHEITLSGTLVDPSVHYLERCSPEPGKGPNFRARVNLHDGQMIVTRDDPLPDAPHARVTLKLLKRVGPEAPEFRPGPPQSVHAYKLATDIRESYSVDLVVPADLAELKRRHTLLPKGFAACAEALNLARAVVTLYDNISRDAGIDQQLEPAWELVKGVIAFADSQQAVLKAMAPALSVSSFAQSSLRGLKLASTVAGGADGAFKMYKGAKILFSDEGDLEYELRQGRSLRAFLQASKGVLQITSGVSGIVAAIPATAALAATPIGLLIAIGSGVVCATLDVALDATQEFEDHVSEFERALDRAQREELHDRCFRASASVLAACVRAEQAV
jgi:hypothetical protein